MKYMKRAIAFAAAISATAAAAVITLWPGLHSWFVADDFWHLAYGRLLSTPWRSWFHPQFGNMAFRPLTFTINFYQIGILGDSTLAVHGFDAALHAINSVLVLALAFRLLKSREEPGIDKKDSWGGPPLLAALAASLVFAVHPVSALTATWFACRADLIATMFSLITLFLLAGKGMPRPVFMIAAGITAFLALSAKVTHLPLVAGAFIVAFAAASGIGRQKTFFAAKKSLPVLNAAAIYICLRLLVLGGMGGYEPIGSIKVMAAQAAYSVPRVYARAGRDLLVHDLGAAGLGLVLAAAGAVLLVMGAYGAVRRHGPMLWGGLVFSAAAVVPAWNLAYMFALREERLLYFPLVGLALVVVALVAGPRRQWARAAAFAAVLVGVLTWVQYSRNRVEDWGAAAKENLRLANALADYVQSPGAGVPVRRIYVLGLSTDSYFLDPMVKLKTGRSFHDRVIIPGDQRAFVWTPADLKHGPDPVEKTHPTTLPRKRVHRSDPEVELSTQTPPDLLEAAAMDPHSRVLEWNGRSVKDIIAELKQLHSRRRVMQNHARAHRGVYLGPSLINFSLPSFNLRKSPMKFDWDVSPGSRLVTPPHLGDPYLLVAEDSDPYIVSPVLSFPALGAEKADLELVVPRRSYLPKGRDQGCLMWETETEPGFQPQYEICFALQADGRPHNYTIELASDIHWARSGDIRRLRIDPGSFPGRFGLIRLEFYTP